ncbi:MAG: RIP metalloprotease RseP [Phycisphaerae bacterium]|nr:RIP metalloprotease RseP [Phycisphaerae bacterium]
MTLAEGGLILAEVPKWLSQVVDRAWPILLLAIGLGLLIFVHELGHFLAAKWMGIRVEVFSLGFGRRLLGFKRGETDYRISVFPLGGYLKMLGQDDLHPEARVDDERAFCSKSVGQRFLVIFAGVVMNMICALALFVVLFRFTGVEFQPAEVGTVTPYKPAYKAGILPGDTILAVDGKGVRDFGELRMRIALAPKGQEVLLQVQRPGQAGPLEMSVLPYLDSTAKIRGIGVEPPASLTVYRARDYAGADGLEKGDTIVGLKFDGEERYYDKYYKFAEAVNERRDKPTAIIAVRDGQKLGLIMLRPHLVAGSNVLGLIPPAKISDIKKDSPAEKAGLKPGDAITSFDNHPWPSNAALAGIAADAEGRQVPISVLRAGKTLNLQITPRSKKHKDKALGIVQEADYQNLIAASDYAKADKNEQGKVAADGSRATLKVDIPAGAKLLKLDDKPLMNWSDVIGRLQERAGSRAKLTYSFEGNTKSIWLTVPPAHSSVWQHGWRFFADVDTKADLITVKTDSLPEAVYIGLHKTWFFIQSIYLTITRVAQGSIGTDALAGPVGITHLSFMVLKQGGITYFLYFMGMIGVNLAMVNFLPIPLLDGGHALFLLFEKIKGSPVSVRVQTIATSIGIAAIAALFLLLTYQDIMRWLS